jgi:hypothetical protein
VNAAVQIQQFYENKKALQAFEKIRIGIHCGQVIAGTVDNGKRREETIVGEPVNTSRTLLSYCAKHDILIGVTGQVFSRVKNIFVGNRIDQLPLSEDVKSSISSAIYEIVGAAETASQEEFKLSSDLEKIFKFIENEEYQSAIDVINNCLKDKPSSKSLIRYLRKCNHLLHAI